MDDAAIARVLHVFGVVLWIGGVAFVTTEMLFVAEPLFLHRWFLDRARRKPAETFALIHRLHWVLLVISLVTVLGAVAGSHGW